MKQLSIFINSLIIIYLLISLLFSPYIDIDDFLSLRDIYDAPHPFIYGVYKLFHRSQYILVFVIPFTLSYHGFSSSIRKVIRNEIINWFLFFEVIIILVIYFLLLNPGYRHFFSFNTNISQILVYLVISYMCGLGINIIGNMEWVNYERQEEIATGASQLFLTDLIIIYTIFIFFDYVPTDIPNYILTILIIINFIILLGTIITSLIQQTYLREIFDNWCNFFNDLFTPIF